MANFGLGVMIKTLGGNESTVNAVKAAIGHKISSISLKNDTLKVVLEDGRTLSLLDGGQSCCEHRYMTTDDVLEQFDGATLIDVQVRDHKTLNCEYGDHEVQFLVLVTDRGNVTAETHNEHNGYYGGFWIEAEIG